MAQEGSGKCTKYDRTHYRNVEMYARQIDALYREAIEQISRLATGRKIKLGDRPFSFSDYPQLKQQADRIVGGLGRDITGAIERGIVDEWALSNAKNDAFVRESLGRSTTRKLGETLHARYYDRSERARDAFVERKENGLGLSDRVWRYTDQFKTEIELGLDTGIRQGRDAGEMSRDLRQYLREPQRLFRRVRDNHGNLVLSKAARAFNPGPGVYRSSYKNARRLAATETNMAYRAADYERWQRLDFVVGTDVHCSAVHGDDDKDICDALAGRYPKGFKFTGWHPHCRCFATAVLKTEEEIEEDERRILAGEEPTPPEESANYVEEMPQGFTDWIDENRKRIDGAASLPYFIRDNYKDGDIGKGFSFEIAQKVATQSQQTLIPLLTMEEWEAIRAAYPEFYRTVYWRADFVYEIDRLPFGTLAPEECTSEKAAAAICGKDKTKGSCSSAALAYAGRRAGYDVLDFRGGGSQTVFSLPDLYYEGIASYANVEIVHSGLEVEAGEQLLLKMEQGKEYILTAGEHASVVRNSGGKYQFLELQDERDLCGWKDFDMSREETGTLRHRFGCELLTGMSYSTLTDIEELPKFKGFRGMLEYINTARAKMQTGKGGGIK